jgi:hypothetical protein
MKIIRNIFLLVCLTVFSSSASAQENPEDLTYEQIYERVNDTFGKFDPQAMIPKPQGETPEIFVEIDQAIENLKKMVSSSAEEIVKKSGIRMDKMTKFNQDKYMEKIKDIDFSSINTDPKILKLKMEIAKKVKKAAEQGLTYTPKIVRNPDEMRKFLSSNPKAEKAMEAAMENNKAAMAKAIYDAIQESKKQKK